jgi:hypothetical protein
MRIDEKTFNILDKASKITLTDYEIKWFDKENKDGYIDTENLISVIDDLLSEIGHLQELIEDMKQPKDEYEDPYSYERWEEHKLMEEMK